MPEGDTIHYAANRIRSVLEGHVPDELLAPHPRHRHDRWAQRLAGRSVRSVDVHGKHLFLRFEGDLTLHSHLRMSGTWGVYRPGQRWGRARRRAWLILRRNGIDVVQFDGPVLELMTDARTRFDQRLAALGPDILGDELDEQRFLRRLREDDPTRPIGDALLDQRTLAGIGNLWKAEACFERGVSPWRSTGRVSDEEALGIVRWAREQMQSSAHRGSRIRPRRVYGTHGRPCPRCGGPVSQREQWDDGRLTYWCARCQI